MFALIFELSNIYRKLAHLFPLQFFPTAVLLMQYFTRYFTLKTTFEHFFTYLKDFS